MLAIVTHRIDNAYDDGSGLQRAAAAALLDRYDHLNEKSDYLKLSANKSH
jgi:hypothetical protein